MNVFFASECNHATGVAPDDQGYPVPDTVRSPFLPRLQLVDGVVVDAYPDLDDGAVMLAITEKHEQERTVNEAANKEINRRAAVLIPRSDFLRRFTREERIAYQQSNDPIVQDFVLLISAGDVVDLEEPDIKDAVEYLEASGLLGANRSSLILA